MADSKARKPPPPTYTPPPAFLPAFPKAKRAKRKSGTGGKQKRCRWVDPDTGDILEWDGRHRKVERYNDRGKHLGEFDPNTGEGTKPADPKRTVTPTVLRPKTKKVTMVYYLTWFDKSGEDYIGESLLPEVGEADVRRVFDLGPDEPPGDCFEADGQHTVWLNSSAAGVNLRFDLYDYFVEARQP